MNITYLIYEAERPRSMMEQREADARAGEFAAAAARLGRSLRHPATSKRNARRDAKRPVRATVTCAIPRPR
ncbi:MAG TPA: hypothetical protein VH021_11795 [Trebonia sp.]|jgi:hypothetical protein|nr:hypothetical protein [Trebonia sp.]